MKFFKIIFVLLFTSVIIFSCSTTIPTLKISEYNIIPVDMSKQIKKDVTIEIEVLKPSEGKNHPELFSFDEKGIHKEFKFSYENLPKDAQGKRWCYTFGFGDNYLSAFKVKLTNNTPHILRMKDSRIYLIDGDQDPIAAITNLGKPDIVNVAQENKPAVLLPKSSVDGDESLIHWVTYFEKEWNNTRKKGILDLYKVGFISQVIAQNINNYKLINSVGVEILPGFSYSGILLFPATVSYDNAKLMFYDITTKTDAAGNPIEKTSFEYPLKLETTNMWYDKNTKTWKQGLPPTL